MSACPVCNTEATTKYMNTPYWVCSYCQCWFQYPMTEKIYEASHEKDENGDFTGHLMSDHDKAVNNALALSILTKWFDNKPIKMLDVGAKYPYFAHCFKNMGCDSYAMDNIEIVPEYSKALDVPMIMADFESWNTDERYDLITMVHCFEHIYNPLEGLKKLRSLVTDTGYVFLRLPDHEVSGFERDLTSGHYEIHPFFHCLEGLLELLVQGQNLFTVEWTSPMAGAGQRDIILKPITKKPIICAGMIVKNEERDLPICLKTIETAVDKLVIVDTGSTDNTLQSAAAVWPATKVFTYEVYTGASEQDSTGDWKLWNFSKARNIFLDLIDSDLEVDYVLWMDADDTLLTPQYIRRASYLSAYSVFGVMIEAGTKWVHHRLWKARTGIRFEGAIHEYPSFGGKQDYVLSNCIIHHDAAPGVGENSNARNLRILEKEYAENKTSRNVFYLANTHKDACRWSEAVKYYDERIRMGQWFRDEWLFSYLYKARCERAANDQKAAEKTLLEALSHAPSWSEYWMELAYMYMPSSIVKAKSMALMASAQVSEPTQLWRETNKYTDQPLRMLTMCCEQEQDYNQALYWAKKAKLAIGVTDVDWDNKISGLVSKTSVIVTPSMVLVRPGAIGDILMTLSLIPELKKTYPEYSITYSCAPQYIEDLSQIMTLYGVDTIIPYPGDYSTYTKCINLVGYPISEGYPSVPMKNHLLTYFAKEMGISPNVCSLAGLPSNDSLPRYATLHTKAGWSDYKNWFDDRWEEVLKTNSDIPVYQLGLATDPKIPGADHSFMGSSLFDSISLISHASLHIGVDSFSNHAAFITNTPAVILWGSTQASASGYDSNTNISLGLPCQPCFKENPAISNMSRGVCDNPSDQTYDSPCHACMTGITVEMVTKAIRDKWNSN